MRALIFLTTLILFQADISAQDEVMALRQSREQGFLFMDLEGNELFKLPPNHDPSVREKKDPFKLGNFYSIDFSENILAVRDENHHYLINRKGEKVKDLQDSLNWVSPIQQGFIRIFPRYQGQRNASWVAYLDKNGDELFDGERFWEASQFRDGHAIVQESKESKWFLIDTLGNKIVNLTDSTAANIRSYTYTPQGLWKLTCKTDTWYNSVFLRPSDGAISKNQMELMPPRTKRKTLDVPDTGLEVDDRIIEKINQLSFMVMPALYQNAEYGYYLFEEKVPGERESTKVLYDHQFNIVTMPEEEGTTFHPFRFFDRFITMEKRRIGIDTTFVFVDTKDMSQGLELDELAHNIRVKGDLLFYETNGIFDFNTVHKIVHLSGKTIYEPSAESTVFTSIGDALAYKDQVRELHLSGTRLSLFELKSFPNLEVLKIDKGFGPRLPHDILSTLKHLRHISIRDCESLTNLPEDVTSVPSLTHLFISECPSLRGLEEVIPQLPALKSLRTDYNYAAHKLKEIQGSHPQLEIEFLLVVVPEGE